MAPGEALIPITFFLSGAMVFIARGEIGKAIAHAIRMRAGGGQQDLEELRGELGELRRDLEQARQELVETQERLDFTERVVARGRAPDQLQEGGG
jgi:hypothetical protein